MKNLIIALLGGGVKGLITTRLWIRITQEFPDLLDKVFLIAGTSIGAAIGAGLCFGKEPKDIEILLYEGMEDALKDSIWDDVKDLGGLVGAEYSSFNLFDIYQKTFGNLKMREAKIPFVATTYDLLSRKPKIFETLTGADDEFWVTDVITGSGAAPLAFDAWNVYEPKRMTLFDGGVLAVDPTDCGIAQARDPRNINGVLDPKDMRILTIGTGMTIHEKREKVDGDWGLITMAQNIEELLIDSKSQITQFKTKQEYGEKYYHLDATIPQPGIKPNDWQARDELLQIADDHDLTETRDWLRKG